MRPPYLFMALPALLAVLPHEPVCASPTELNAMMQAMAMSASIRLYSIAVPPLSSRAKLRIDVTILDVRPCRCIGTSIDRYAT